MAIIFRNQLIFLELLFLIHEFTVVKKVHFIQVRHGGGGRHPPLAPESVWETKMNIHASQWTKWTSINIFLFWAAVWGIPLACLPIYTTLFKGVPELRAIPEGYEPREEEYQRNLVTRWFITSGFCESEQQRHEELIFNRWEADNSSKRRLLINEVSQNSRHY